MSFAVRYSKRDVVWIKLAYWSDNVQIASKMIPDLRTDATAISSAVSPDAWNDYFVAL